MECENNDDCEKNNDLVQKIIADLSSSTVGDLPDDLGGVKSFMPLDSKNADKLAELYRSFPDVLFSGTSEEYVFHVGGGLEEKKGDELVTVCDIYHADLCNKFINDVLSYAYVAGDTDYGALPFEQQ